jgi:predicted nucleotidyltransferase
MINTVKIDLLTAIENKVLNKRLNNKKLNQVEANYLSRSVRPKLRKLEKLKEIDEHSLLQRIEYNQKGRAIELKIKKLVKELIQNVSSIIIYGSAIQTNYHSYRDIDVCIITPKKIWSNEKEKYFLIKTIKERAENFGLVLDVQIIEGKRFYLDYPSNPDLVYQLKDSKVIYGSIKIPEKIIFSKLDLQMKLDWSDIGFVNPEGIEIYKAIRNAFLVELLFKKIVDNQKLNESVYNEIGRKLMERLKNNTASRIERKIALNYLNERLNKTRRDIKEAKWEKIEL